MIFLDFLNKITTNKYGFMIELFLCEMLFSYKSKRRKIARIPFLITYIAAYAVYFTAAYFIPLFPIPSLRSLSVFAVSVLAACAVFDVSVNRNIFNCVAGYALQNLAVNISSVFFSFASLREWDITGWARFFIRLFIKLITYVICYFVLAKKAQSSELNIRHIRLYITSLLTVAVTSVLFSIVRNNQSFGMEINLALTMCCLLALMLQFSDFSRGNLDKETETLERLLYYEQKQHNLTQEAIDLINMKSHDLKRQVIALKELWGDKAELLLGDTEKIITAYDDMVKTGNKYLDLIISEVKNYCVKYGIVIDTIVDGAQLDFMTPSDMYSLFSNALHNAFECVKYETASDRTISLNVHLNGEYICISITNICTHDIKFINGLPVTSKADKKFHGYGMRSMEYIVAKYGGNMVVNFEDNIFTVKIIIRKPS